jgi:murein DD-endopeptidase MepM/ murein hydrolase activator NlpD
MRRRWLWAVVSAYSAQPAWLRYFSHLIHQFTWQARESARAALAARAVLEGAPPGQFLLSESGIAAQTRWRRSRWLRGLSPRLAAHIVVVGLVISIALLSSRLELNFAGSANIHVVPERIAHLGSSDVQVQRQMTLASEPDSNDQILPVVSAQVEQFEPAFTESHLLLEGETLGDLAQAYHVSVESIFWSNDLGSSHIFAAGQILRIPRMSGVPYVIEPTDTLESIAARFQVSPQAITLFKPNNVAENQPLPIGREVFIPGGVLTYSPDYLAQHGNEAGIAAMPAVAAGTVQEADTNLRTGPGREYPRLGYLDAGQRLKLLARHGAWVKVEGGSGGAGWVRADLLGLTEAAIAPLVETNDFPPPPPRWVWPTRGSITSPFGWRTAPWRMFHDGLDIANKAGTKVYAARAGTVSEAGWCSGFGYCVKIDHGDGVTTIYGHLLKRPPVRRGEAVSAGDMIGLMGSTYDASGGGYSTGVHLHFTIKVNGKAVNPLKFLP